MAKSKIPIGTKRRTYRKINGQKRLVEVTKKRDGEKVKVVEKKLENRNFHTNWPVKGITEIDGEKKYESEKSKANTITGEIYDGINAPYKDASFSMLGYPRPTSYFVSVSLDKKDTWPNGYLMNSRYRKFSWYPDTGELNDISGSYKAPKFRKTKARNVQEVHNKINAWVKKGE